MLKFFAITVRNTPASGVAPEGVDAITRLINVGAVDVIDMHAHDGETTAIRFRLRDGSTASAWLRLPAADAPAFINAMIAAPDAVIAIEDGAEAWANARTVSGTIHEKVIKGEELK